MEKHLEIIHAENGVVIKDFVCEEVFDTGKLLIIPEIKVIEEVSQQELIRRTCIEVAKYLGYLENNYSKENIRISFDGNGCGVSSEE